MARWLKEEEEGIDETAHREIDNKIRQTVEDAIRDVEAQGDAAVRELSVKFDGLDRESYRLTEREIQACLNELSEEDLADIKFATSRRFNAPQCSMLSKRRFWALSSVIRTSR